LSGTLTGSFAVNDNLNLYFPSTAYVSGTGVVLDYTGQDGTMATIASKYDYSVASVTATTVDNASQSFETTAATFANQAGNCRVHIRGRNDTYKGFEDGHLCRIWQVGTESLVVF
jgi:hypothetical protein